MSCDYLIPDPPRDARPCKNTARWVVTYLSPDNGAMRRRVTTRRCTTHLDGENFFPVGATQITPQGEIHRIAVDDEDEEIANA